VSALLDDLVEINGEPTEARSLRIRTHNLCNMWIFFAILKCCRVAKQSIPKRGTVGSGFNLSVLRLAINPALPRFGTDCF